MRVGANRRLLVIDDNDAIHEDFRKILAPPSQEDLLLTDVASLLFGAPVSGMAAAETFEIDSARQGQEGLDRVREACRQGRPYAMAFVDVRMPPGWDGVETVRHLWNVDPDLQVVFCTAHSDRSWEDTVQILGLTDRFLILKKPFDNVEVRQMAVALTEKWRLTRQARQVVCDLEQTVERRTREVVATRDACVFALAKLAESRDPETGEHLERMRAYAQLLAEHLRCEGPYTHLIDEEFIANLYLASPLHDAGKVSIADAILLKPGRLTPDEFEVMKTHAELGAKTLESMFCHCGQPAFLQMAIDIARHHHERYDGRGYPAGLSGQGIPLAARIVAVADVYDALTSARVYKAAFAAEQAREMIEEQEGQHFDPAVVAAFRACYPDFLAIQHGSRRGYSPDALPSEAALVSVAQAAEVQS